MKSGTPEPSIRIRRYGRVPPPAVELEERWRAPAPGFPWKRVVITFGSLAAAAGAVASVSLLLR